MSKHPYFYTQEEENWLIDNVDNFINTIELTKEFNIAFNKKRRADAVKCKIRHLMPEHKYGWSGGKQVGFGSSITASPIGAERWQGGYWYVKIADHPLPKNFTTEDLRKNWVAKHRYVWEQANGEIPKDGVIVFLDTDRSNCDLSNLYCTTRKITAPMRRFKWFSTDKNITLAAIKLCELLALLKEQSIKGG